MENLNSAIFNRIKQKNKSVALVRSVRVTGKTTDFKNWMIKRAVLYGENFDVIFRNVEEKKEKFNKNWIFLPRKISVRMKNTVRKFHKYITFKKGFMYYKDRPIAEAIDINRAIKYKGTENTIKSSVALYDEYLPEDGIYLADETDKFTSLVVTRKRNNKYRVFGMGNDLTLIDRYKIDAPKSRFFWLKNLKVYEEESDTKEKSEMDEWVDSTSYGKKNKGGVPMPTIFLKKKPQGMIRIMQLVLEPNEIRSQKMFAIYNCKKGLFVKKINKLKPQKPTLFSEKNRIEFTQIIAKLFARSQERGVSCMDWASLYFIDTLDTHMGRETKKYK